MAVQNTISQSGAENIAMIDESFLASKILEVRGQIVILDFELAKMYSKSIAGER